MESSAASDTKPNCLLTNILFILLTLVVITDKGSHSGSLGRPIHGLYDIGFQWPFFHCLFHSVDMLREHIFKTNREVRVAAQHIPSPSGLFSSYAFCFSSTLFRSLIASKYLLSFWLMCVPFLAAKRVQIQGFQQFPDWNFQSFWDMLLVGVCVHILRQTH